MTNQSEQTAEDEELFPPAQDKEKPILVTQSSMPSLEDYVSEIASLWNSRWLTNRGAKVRQLEKELSTFLDSSRNVLFANGHLALETLIQAFELTGEVITTPFTFASTTHAITRMGLTPVFCDVKEDDYTLDPSKIEELITPRTSAIIPVHVYGAICDVQEIERIAKKHGLKVIYDAAHAFGAKKKGISSASFGDAAMFSFHATKVFHTIEGGAAFVRDEEKATRLEQLQNFGLTGPEEAGYAGNNSKMNEFAAAMGLCNLRTVENDIAQRKRVDTRYRLHLEREQGLTFLELSEEDEHNYAYFPIRINKEVFGVSRDQVFETLTGQDIGARRYFTPLTSEFKCYSGLFDSSLTPIALKVSREVLCLPLYPNLTDEQVDRICAVLLACNGSSL